MDSPPVTSGGLHRSLHPLQSVRVRITLAAALVTAVAVGGAGWLLVRSVENEQIDELRGDVEQSLDRVVTRLEAGNCWEDALRDTPTFGFVSVTDETGQGRAVATGLHTTVLDLKVEETATAPAPGSSSAPTGEATDRLGERAGDGAAADTASCPADREGAGDTSCAPDGQSADGPATCATACPGESDQSIPNTDGPATDREVTAGKRTVGQGAEGGPSPTTDGLAPDGGGCRQVTVSGGPGGTAAWSLPEDTFVVQGPPPDSGPAPRGAAGPGPVIGAVGSATRLETITRAVQTPDGRVTVTAAVPVDQMARSLAALRGALMVGLPALIAVVAALVWVLVGRALRPVEAIRAEVDAITGSTMHRRVPEPVTGDEIGRLARTMNAMLGRLDTAATRQRQFVSDASHELRSPVAAIRTCLEVARHSPERANWPAVADTALAEESRLEALLDDLLLLAAADENGAAARSDAAVDLGALAEVEARRPRPVAVRVTLPPDEAEPLTVPGDAGQLARALGNLVDNAARYAVEAVHVGLSLRGDVVRVTVDDDGPGVPADARDRVFERFARLDDGRARDQGGTGLGLAVVRSIAARHRGLVWVEDSPLGGARFVIELAAGQHTTAVLASASASTAS
jgi:signal transduction histidine kinase